MTNIEIPINFVLIENGIARRFTHFDTLQRYLALPEDG